MEEKEVVICSVLYMGSASASLSLTFTCFSSYSSAILITAFRFLILSRQFQYHTDDALIIRVILQIFSELLYTLYHYFLFFHIAFLSGKRIPTGALIGTSLFL